MKEIESRILDILSRQIGNPISIRKIRDKINEIYGHAHYPMIYSTIQDMAERKILVLDKYGKSSIASLNFENSLLIDSLAQVELINKVRFLEKRKDWQTLVLLINGYFREYSTIKSILIHQPERNAKLNRMELFIVLRNDEQIEEQKNIHKIMGLLQQVQNIRLDFLLISEADFSNLLRGDANPIKEILADKIVIFYPQTFWFIIKEMSDEGIQIHVQENIHPAKISEQDIEYNLDRLGYSEFGTKIVGGNNIGTEYLVASLLIKGDARRREAIPIILAKNSEKTNFGLLVFLCQKYGVAEKIFPVLKLVYEVKPSDDLGRTIKMLKDLKITEEKINTNEIKKKMRLYNVK